MMVLASNKDTALLTSLAIQHGGAATASCEPRSKAALTSMNQNAKSVPKDIRGMAKPDRLVHGWNWPPPKPVV